MPSTGDYLIKDDSIDWTAVINGWEGLVPEALRVYLINRFGEIFVTDMDGAVHLLDPGGLNCERIADSKDHFVALMNANFGNWLMVELTDQCVAKGMTLAAGQCYGFQQPPCLGGKYEIDNVAVMDLAAYHGDLSRIYQQTKDLPPGSAVDPVILGRKQ